MTKATHGATELHCADNREILASLPDHSVDAIITDPPYGLAFMGKHWDYDVPDVATWAECLRVLKPGGHLLAFAGTRTQHRMAVKIEDAGFDIRDLIAWVYGSGFPKSHDVSKAIDKAAGVEREVLATIPDRWAGKGAVLQRSEQAPAGSVNITGPASDPARTWQGWGTALKPALEPITVARKPLSGTVAANVLQYGTGALNIDASRVEGSVTINPLVRNGVDSVYGGWKGHSGCESIISHGRWPANLIHDGREEVLELFPVSDKQQLPRIGGFRDRPAPKSATDFKRGTRPSLPMVRGDNGTSARFFYSAKASRRERGHGNTHPTVKPLALMRYLCRLVTPPGGLILDPYLGSGTTAIAALETGFRFIGIEREEEYFQIALNRLKSHHP